MGILGTSDTTFKNRYCNHTQDFNHERYSKCTELSQYIQQLKRNKKLPSIERKIVQKVFSDVKSNQCLLCLREKYFIINYSHKEILLNKPSELIGKCRHKNKNMLANIGNRSKRNNDGMD